VLLYAPYCQGLRRRPELEAALALLAAGELEGARRLRPAGRRRFRMRWQAAISPLDLMAVRLCFEGPPGQPPLEYSFQVASHRLVLWLMDRRIQAEAADAARDTDTDADTDAPVDLPESFWQWLILGVDPATAAA